MVLGTSEMYLRENSDFEVMAMARSVRVEWDDYDRSGKPYLHESPKEMRTNSQVASVGCSRTSNGILALLGREDVNCG